MLDEPTANMLFNDQLREDCQWPYKNAKRKIVSIAISPKFARFGVTAKIRSCHFKVQALMEKLFACDEAR